jgi:hypothetical protein
MSASIHLKKIGQNCKPKIKNSMPEIILRSFLLQIPIFKVLNSK